MEQIWTTSIGKQQGIDLLNAHAQWYCNDIEPTITYPFQNWADTGNNLWKQRNEANDAWITRGTLDAINFGLLSQSALDEAVAELQPARIHVPVRQTVLQGLIDENGQASFLSVGTGLSINLLASSTPLILAFAYGFDNNYGQVDYVSSITSDQLSFWSNLPPNQTFIQLYIDRNLTTGVLTGGYTLKETAYGIAPPHFNTQHWYDYSNTTFMKVSDGNSWSNVQRIMVGECTTNADSVTSVVCYAIQGKYDSGWFNVALSREYSKSHNIGRSIDDLIVYGWIRTDSTKKKRVINNLSSGGYGGLSDNDAGEILAIQNNSVYLRTSRRLHPSYSTGSDGISRYPDVDDGVGQARIFVKRGF